MTAWKKKYCQERTIIDVIQEIESRQQNRHYCVKSYNLPEWTAQIVYMSDQELFASLLGDNNFTINQWFMIAKLRERQQVLDFFC